MSGLAFYISYTVHHISYKEAVTLSLFNKIITTFASKNNKSFLSSKKYEKESFKLHIRRGL